jgi:hypothetical protein
MIRYIIRYYIMYIFNCNCVDTRWQQYSTYCVDTRWQQYSTYSHTNITQCTENGTHITVKSYRLIWEMRAVPRLCELCPGICLATEEKARENLS